MNMYFIATIGIIFVFTVVIIFFILIAVIKGFRAGKAEIEIKILGIFQLIFHMQDVSKELTTTKSDKVM